jgi:CRISPR-associated protein Csm5
MMKNIANGSVSEMKYNEFQIFAEMIKGYLLDCSKSVESTITIDEDLQNIKGGVSKHISINDIIKSCNSFYLKQFTEEYDKFYANKMNRVKIIDSLYDEIDSISKSKNQFVIRVGRWSQCEAMTYQPPFRKPKTDDDKSFGATRTVLNYDGEFVPLGWCKCTIK